VIRLLFAAAIAIAVSLIGTRLLIDWLTRLRIGQPIREDGPSGHLTKAGTPIMGGVAIVAGAGLGWLVSDLLGGTYTRRGILVIITMGLAGLVGLADDWLKVSRAHNLGLSKRAKFGALTIVSILFVVGVLRFTHIATTLSLTRFDYPGIQLHNLGWAVWAIFLILATTNAVNLTDGLDGLAAGSAVFGFAAFVVIGFWGFRHQSIYGDQSFLDLAVVSASMLGACTGFLWWNAAPAKIFMGDTGALAIGAALATLALSTNTSLLLILICGLNFVETISVIIQVGSFKLTGRRVFRMAPIHHHFELAGWPETTVIVRFWILAGLCTALALGIYYADFVRLGVNY
jgi:phospho-N-acetylmuramoyl-pentapeptide-transferase